jgi:sulfur carrier protein ThiS
MRARVTLVADAFNPLRSMQVVEVDRPVTIRAFLDGRGIAEFPVPTICLKNGRPLLRRHWAGTIIDHDDIVAFVAQPLGGGGGSGGKNPLTTVLMVAVNRQSTRPANRTNSWRILMICSNRDRNRSASAFDPRMNGGFIIPSALPARRMESRPERAEKSEFYRWEFAGFQGVNSANPANTIILTKAETSLGGGLQRSSQTTKYMSDIAAIFINQRCNKCLTC